VRNPAAKDPRSLKLAALFAEAGKRGIEADQLRNEIAPAQLGKRLSAASETELGRLLRHLTGGRRDPGSSPSGRQRYADLGRRDGMASPGQLRLIEALWMNVSRMPDREAKERALKGFLKRIVGVEDMRFIEGWMVQKIIRAVQAMGRQAQGGTHGPQNNDHTQG
jgi:hypothetical protein